MIDPATLALYIPQFIIDQNKFKILVFERVGATCGRVIRGDPQAVRDLPDEIVPIIGCSPEFRDDIAEWRKRGRKWIYWDRGYLRRVFATWLPRATNRQNSYYRWHVNSFQMQAIGDVPEDRFRHLMLTDQLQDWKTGGDHIVILDVGPDYWDLHTGDRDWCRRVAAALREHTKRPIVIRDKESKVPLYKELEGAHALVSHGSVGAVEAIVWGYPVFVHPDSAAAVMGETDFSKIETPRYPDYRRRWRWLCSLAYHQFNEHEMNDGTLWRMLRNP